MGYRYECLDCDWISWYEESKKRKQKHIYLKKGHRIWGDSNIWAHPNGDYFKYTHSIGEGCGCKECRKIY